jgi:hypothetical protein
MRISPFKNIPLSYRVQIYLLNNVNSKGLPATRLRMACELFA